MTEGISKETLEEIAIGFDRQNREYACLVRSLISECTELDPWLVIDENTPNEKELLLRFPGGHQEVCEYSELLFIVQPTHYKLLPEDPK